MSTPLKQSIRAALRAVPASAEEEALWPMKDGPGDALAAKRWLRGKRVPAAVLVPLIERNGAIDVLLTQRADSLRDHAGQVSFPGGRIETSDASPWHAAVREAHEEVGLEPRSIEFAGYLPDHYVGTGFRVTPAVGFVTAPLRLKLAPAEVTEVFEVPLAHVFNVANRSLKLRTFDGITVHFHDIKFEHRSIWGATAAMLISLQRLLDEKGGVSV